MKQKIFIHWAGILLFALIPFLSCTDDPQPTTEDTETTADITDTVELESEDSQREIDLEPEIIDPEHFEAIRTVFQEEFLASIAPGAAIAIIEGGVITYSEGFGTTRYGGSEPVTENTLFRIGSLTKIITAMGIMTLVDDGLLELSSSLSEILPEFDIHANPGSAGTITVDQLLTHSAAIFDYLVLDSEQREDEALSEFLYGEFEEISFLLAPPGRMWNYSNSNYLIAGLIIETLSESPYKQAVKKRVLTPLGMNRTFFLPSEVINDGNYTEGITHTSDDEEVVVGPDSYDNGWVRPAGFAFSSVSELAQIVKFLRQGDEQILSEESRGNLFAPHIDTELNLSLPYNGYAPHYGLGLVINQGLVINGLYYDLQIIKHAGQIAGFSADLYYFPELDFGFITLAGTDNLFFTETLNTALITLCDLPTPVPAPNIDSRPDDFESYIGSYLDQQLGPMEIYGDEDNLMIEVMILEQEEINYNNILVPFSRNNYILEIGSSNRVSLTFILDENNQAEYLRARAFVAQRQNNKKKNKMLWFDNIDKNSRQHIIKKIFSEKTNLSEFSLDYL